MDCKLRIALLAGWLAACTAPVTPRPTITPFIGTPRSVIVDSDLAADDWLAILYLLRQQDISVKAIAVTGTGEAHCGPGVRIALGLVTLAGQPNLPVACGRETPLQGTHAFPTEWRTSVDSLLGLTLPEGANPARTGSAVELLTTAVSAASGKVTLLTLGPLTNIAETLQAAPRLAEKIEMIYIMGGAVEASGNVGASGVGIENDVAEWNFYVDPHAANLVLQSGVPVTLIPLDATQHVPVTADFYSRFERDHVTPEAAFVYAVLTQEKGFIESGSYYFWDPLAAAILVDESLATFDTRRLTVGEDEGPESGGLRPAESGPAIRFAVSADGPRFEQLFLDALNADRP